MGNTFTNKKAGDQTIGMSNGLTSVFIDTLTLAGADIAIENYQKDIMIWLAQRDSTIMGMGVEGFDIVEILWDPTIFDAQKAFILQVIDRAIQKTNWERLDYSPNEEYAMHALTDFRKMIVDFIAAYITPAEQEGIQAFDESIRQYDRCEKHGVYLNFHGCVVCHNA